MFPDVKKQENINRNHHNVSVTMFPEVDKLGILIGNMIYVAVLVHIIFCFLTKKCEGSLYFCGYGTEEKIGT